MNQGIFESFDGTGIFYTENLNNSHGNLPKIPITFIHGQSGGNHTMLKHQMNCVEKDYPVLAFDLRGGGRSDLKPNQEDYSLENLAKDALGLLEHRKVQKTNIVSYSLGTTIALKLFELCPEKINSLVLLHPTYNPLKTTGKLNQFIVNSGLNTVFENTVAYTFALINRLKGVNQMSYMDYTKLEIKTGIGSYVNTDYIKSRTPKELLTRVKFAFARLQWDVEEVLKKVDVPVLCISGGADSWTLPSAAEEIASRVQNGRCKIFPGNKHSAIYDHEPKEINEVILEFLKEFG